MFYYDSDSESSEPPESEEETHLACMARSILSLPVGDRSSICCMDDLSATAGAAAPAFAGSTGDGVSVAGGGRRAAGGAAAHQPVEHLEQERPASGSGRS